MLFKVKLEIFTKKSGKIDIVGDLGPGASKGVILNCTTNESIEEFPTANITLNVDMDPLKVLSIKRDDKIVFYVSNDKTNNKFSKMFAGEIAVTEYKTEKDKYSILNLKAISSFYKLQLIMMTQEIFSKSNELEDLLKNIIRTAGISGKLLIEDGLKISLDGYVYKMSVFAFLKILVLQNDLVLVFRRGDIMQLSRKETERKRLSARPTTTIGPDEILSMNIQDI